MTKTQLQRGTKIVVASHNPGKVWEINQLIAPYGLNAVSAGELGLAEPEETEPTFHGNAGLKALSAAQASGLPALADDSGLEVDVLGGAPGIYSARWAGPGKDFGAAMSKVAQEVTARHGWTAPGPRANFISVLCLASPDGDVRFFEGKVDGHLVWPPRGGNGFGYDPMFVPDGEARTFGEMEPKEKYAVSHRTRAFAKFRSDCLEHIPQAAASAPSGRDLAALSAAAANLSTRDELVRFLSELDDDFARNGSAWPAQTAGALIQALRGHFDRVASNEDEPRWRTLAKALLEASKTASPPAARGNPEVRGYYLDDLTIGQKFTSAPRSLSEAEITAFARAFDPQPFHLDDGKAKSTLFGGLAASGWHTAAITMRLNVDGGLPLAGGLIGAEVEVAWPKPTRPGDVLQVENEILEIVPSRSRPDRGMVRVRSTTRNAGGEIMQVMTGKMIVPRAPRGS